MAGGGGAPAVVGPAVAAAAAVAVAAISCCCCCRDTSPVVMPTPGTNSRIPSPSEADRRPSPGTNSLAAAAPPTPALSAETALPLVPAAAPVWPCIVRPAPPPPRVLPSPCRPAAPPTFCACGKGCHSLAVADGPGMAGRRGELGALPPVLVLLPAAAAAEAPPGVHSRAVVDSWPRLAVS